MADDARCGTSMHGQEAKLCLSRMYTFRNGVLLAGDERGGSGFRAASALGLVSAAAAVVRSGLGSAARTGAGLSLFPVFFCLVLRRFHLIAWFRQPLGVIITKGNNNFVANPTSDEPSEVAIQNKYSN